MDLRPMLSAARAPKVAELVEAAPLSQTALQPFWKRARLWQGFILLALVAWLYVPILVRLIAQWWQDPNFSHGFFVPAFAVYLLWQDRKRLRALRATPSLWGLPIIIFAICALALGVFGAEIFVSRMSLLLLLAGLTVFFMGWQTLRAIQFPLLFLILMIPIPAIVFGQVTFPLQILASKLSAGVLPLLGVPVFREGNVINLPAMPLEVAEACSGIRSLLSLTTLAIMYGYLLEKKIAIRIILALASVPIAVAANGLRIVGTGLLVQYWDPDTAEGFFHAFSGWLIFVASLLMLFGLHKCLSIPDRRKESAA
jgi:exosortase